MAFRQYPKNAIPHTINELSRSDNLRWYHRDTVGMHFEQVLLQAKTAGFKTDCVGIWFVVERWNIHG